MCKQDYGFTENVTTLGHTWKNPGLFRLDLVVVVVVVVVVVR